MATEVGHLRAAELTVVTHIAQVKNFRMARQAIVVQRVFLDRAQVAAKADLLGGGNILAGKNQDQMIQPSLTDGRHRGRIEFLGQVHVGDGGAQRVGQPGNGNAHGFRSPLFRGLQASPWAVPDGMPKQSSLTE